jgi:hypothetical protein
LTIATCVGAGASSSGSLKYERTQANMNIRYIPIPSNPTPWPLTRMDPRIARVKKLIYMEQGGGDGSFVQGCTYLVVYETP